MPTAASSSTARARRLLGDAIVRPDLLGDL
jgi:hypothetical protein